MEALLYFAYGSNMSSRRLRQRVPSARAGHAPGRYIRLIENVPVLDDADRRRVTAERRVHWIGDS